MRREARAVLPEWPAGPGVVWDMSFVTHLLKCDEEAALAFLYDAGVPVYKISAAPWAGPVCDQRLALPAIQAAGRARQQTGDEGGSSDV